MKASEMPSGGILQGVNVVGCSTAVAAPFASAMFSENGANVIHIENHKVMGDVLKHYGHGFCMEHRNQRSLGLDLKNEGGKGIFRKTIAQADIFIESSKPGTWDRLGFDDETLWGINPALVIVHVSGFGQSGDPSYVTQPAYDMIGQAFSGTLSLNGPATGAPMLTKPYTCDYFTGFTALWSALAALLKARETGVGESIDVALFEAAARVQAGSFADGITNGIQPKRIGNADAGMATEVVYATKDDKWVVLAIASVPQSFIETIGLSEDPDFNPAGFVRRNEPRAQKYMDAVESYCLTHTVDEILADSARCGCACSPVMTYDMIKENSHYAARETIQEWFDPFADHDVKGVGNVPKFKNNPGAIYRGAPTLGMDNDDILAELGYSAEEIAGLYAEKAIGKDK